MTLFERIEQYGRKVKRLAMPEDPIEGMLKLLIYSQIVTVPMTLFSAAESWEQVVQNSHLINTIHQCALSAGCVMGAFGWADKHYPRQMATLIVNTQNTLEHVLDRVDDGYDHAVETVMRWILD